jgi:hypothetical protein
MEPISRSNAPVIYLIRARGLCRRQFAFILGVDSNREHLPYYTEILFSCHKTLKAIYGFISDIIVLGNETAGC